MFLFASGTSDLDDSAKLIADLALLCGIKTQSLLGDLFRRVNTEIAIGFHSVKYGGYEEALENLACRPSHRDIVAHTRSLRVSKWCRIVASDVQIAFKVTLKHLPTPYCAKWPFLYARRSVATTPDPASFSQLTPPNAVSAFANSISVGGSVILPTHPSESPGSYPCVAAGHGIRIITSQESLTFDGAASH